MTGIGAGILLVMIGAYQQALHWTAPLMQQNNPWAWVVAAGVAAVGLGLWECWEHWRG
jgi:hypothetical protein